MSGITRAEAKKRATEYLTVLFESADEAVILDDLTVEDDFGWVFFYQSRAYTKTGDPSQMLVGNAPIIVDREGALHETGTSAPVEEYIRAYRAAGTLRVPRNDTSHPQKDQDPR
jgi:hypothetical protein